MLSIYLKNKYFYKYYLCIFKFQFPIFAVLKPKHKNPKISISESTEDQTNSSDLINMIIDYSTTVAEKLTSQIPGTSSNSFIYFRNRVPHSFPFFTMCAK